jgi:peptidoglycan hydrolase-like protein with peptidoglycan-binding domain
MAVNLIIKSAERKIIMARKVIVSLPPVGKGPQPIGGPPVINETSVGAGGNNKRRSDVQLVQFFLRQFYKSHRSLFEKLPPTKNPDGFVKIDGSFGPQTQGAISTFQNHEKSLGLPIATDGLVDVPKGMISSISGTVYTIVVLNSLYNFLEARSTGGFVTNIQDHPDIVAFAPELRSELNAQNTVSRL